MNHHSHLSKNDQCQENMKFSQDILKMFGYTPGCAKCRKLSRNEYSHPGLAHSQDCRTIERWNGARLIIQEEPHWNRVSCLDHKLKRQKLKIIRVLGMSSGLWEPEQDLSGEIPIPSADETLTTAVPSGVTPQARLQV